MVAEISTATEWGGNTTNSDSPRIPQQLNPTADIVNVIRSYIIETANPPNFEAAYTTRVIVILYNRVEFHALRNNTLLFNERFKVNLR